MLVSTVFFLMALCGFILLVYQGVFKKNTGSGRMCPVNPTDREVLVRNIKGVLPIALMVIGILGLLAFR